MASLKLEVNGNRWNTSIVTCLGFSLIFFFKKEKEPKDFPLVDTSQHIMFRAHNVFVNRVVKMKFVLNFRT